MKKNKAKDGIVVNAGNGNYIPNIVRGGAAIPIGKKNFYYMQGRKHEQGGIDVGRNPKTGLEVEGEEVMQVTPNEVRVYSSVPFLRGVSPAELVLNGANANKVFAAQEKYKDNNRINDDGTKYKYGGDNRQSTDSINKNTNTFNPNDFTFRSINTLDKLKSVEFKNGNYANYVEIPFNKMDTIVAKTLGNGNNLELNKYIIRGFANSLTRNPLKFIDGLQKSVNENVMEALIKSGTKSKNNIIITDYGKKEFGGNTNNKNKMGKLVSINGNVKNGLIHTPNQDVLAYNKERKPRFNGRYSKPGLHNLELLVSDLILPKGKVNIEPDVPKRLGWVEAHNRLVGADISQKPLDAKKDNTNVVHTISETERRTRKFVCGGRSKAKVGKGFRINNDKYNIGDTITYKDKQYVVTDRNEAKPINKKLDNYVDGVTGAARRISTSPQLTRNITNGLVNNTPTYKKNGETHYFVEAPKVDYDSGTSLADLQNLLNLTPRKGSNQSSSSSTGGVNNRTSKSAKPTIQRVNRLAPATNAEMAGIRRGLEPLLQNTIVDKLNKTVDNDLNVMPVQDDVAKTRNMDNILLGVNLGSSVLDAVMGNIYANQMHGYTAPNITAPTIKNPGEIKLNEEDLKDIPAPILMAAAKLKTRYNANPQLSKIEDDTRRIMGEIGRNTSNSRVALARKQRAALQGQQAKNEVYGRKENIETELINKDKLNQQEVTARNLARYDQYTQALAAQRANRARLRLAADTANIQNKLAVNTANAQLKSQADRFNTANKINQLVHQAGIDSAKAEARSNIFSGMLGNIGSALNTWNRNKRQAKLDEETLRVLGLRTPNANKLVLSALGY
nr:MAG: hypothetical protein [Bacteriophage sp.]